MPIGIDFARIAERIEAQIQPLMAALLRLGAWLSQRVEQEQERERVGRGFPVIRFNPGYNAVTIWIDPLQHGVLSTTEQTGSIGETLKVSELAFLRGLERTRRAVREDLILPQFVGTITEALEAMLASVERFAEPRSTMFDPLTHRLSDLSGEFALLIRAFTSNTSQIIQLGESLARAKAVLGNPTEMQGGIVAGAGDSFLTGLDHVARNLVGAILLLPIIPNMLMLIVRSAALNSKLTLLDIFKAIEKQVLNFRKDIFQFCFNKLFEYLQRAERFVIAAQIVIVSHVAFYSDFGISYVRELFLNFRRFADELSQFLESWISALRVIGSVLEDILDFDLASLFMNYLGLPTSIAATMPAFAIGDLVDVTARDKMALFLEGLGFGGALHLIPGLHQRLNGLRKLLGIILAPPPKLPPEAQRPALAGERFPNISELFFGSRAPELLRTLSTLGDDLKTGVQDIVEACMSFTGNISFRFAEAAAQATRIDSPDRYQRVLDQATGLAEGVFGEEINDLRQRMAAQPVAMIGQEFDRWVVVRAGFNAIGSIISLYIAEMHRYWQDQVEHAKKTVSGEKPTSPHILARRQRLGLVRAPRVVIYARGRILDDALASEIVTRFQGVIVDAYRTGQDQLTHSRTQ